MVIYTIFPVFRDFYNDILNHKREDYIVTNLIPKGATISMIQPETFPKKLEEIVCIGQTDTFKPILAVKKKKPSV